ncbi:hypothetical protein [Sulfitobacter geojensis]|uniref:hypothetical protein n=1 Tax=Sulfitobacter geojensis TaxID=1342299 RepID=UPI0009DF75F5|nr:hypothetical protein [Sulfitobacter geojensis]NYI27462.1 acetyltransferase-like isoleucine patch superfamily enzyme [Sulfitobacter geojensis]
MEKLQSVHIGRYKRKLISHMLKFSSIRLNSSVVPRGTRLNAPLSIGYHNRINGPAILKGHAPITLGNYNALGDNIRIISSNHPRTVANQLAITSRLRLQRQHTKIAGVRLESDIWIGDSTIILPGVVVGNGAIIGAGSVVTRSVEAFSIVAGVPARKVGSRFSQETITLLQNLAWWERPVSELQDIKEVFSCETEEDILLHLKGITEATKAKEL